MNKKGVLPVSPLVKSVAILKKSCEAIHIKKLRFPNYRNLELGSILYFEFPITILLGRNGTNKSSILHALYGSVARNTMADFWFETEIDAIPATINNVKQSVTHSYLDSENNLVESIKARAPRKSADPDYWEPVKPSKVYGFTSGATRVPPIQLKVTHLDFRGELPAFDKYFYFPDKKDWTLIFKTKHIESYSEAFAGSGESAIALIVHKVLNAPDKSLILLDEPETSLHPRAQQRLLEFLAEQSVHKSLQMVMATHSIYLAKNLPNSAIRVMEMGSNGRQAVTEWKYSSPRETPN